MVMCLYTDIVTEKVYDHVHTHLNVSTRMKCMLVYSKISLSSVSELEVKQKVICIVYSYF